MITKEQYIEYVYNSETNRLYDIRAIAKHSEELQEFIDAFYPNKTIKEVAYILVNNIIETPTCKYCGKPLIFHDFIHGYREYCSKKCAAMDKNPEQKVSDQIVNKNAIINIFIKNGQYIEQRCTEQYLKKNGWYTPLISYYKDSNSCFETIYRIVNDLDIRPVCKYCGKPLAFNYGFSTFCSRSCSNKDEDVKRKNSDSVRISQANNYKLNKETINEKRRLTNLQKHNVDSPTLFSSEQYQKKALETIKNKYGVSNVFQIEKNRYKSIKSNQERSIIIRHYQGYDISYLNMSGETKVLVHNGCAEHGDLIMDLIMFNNRVRPDRKNNITLCPICNPKKNPETSIETVIKNILFSLDVKYIQHDRTLIKPYELDFYLPDFNIAIECNGIYWHSGFDNGQRLIKKYNICADRGIRLVYFWENDILNKPEIVRGYLMSMLKKNISIYARNCEVVEITADELKYFTNANHLQGHINASFKIGLKHNNELLSIMSFGKCRLATGEKSEDNKYELYRLCSKIGYSVIGGASKMFSYFIKKINPDKVITYCSKDISYGNVYEKLGFNLVKDCGQGFSYIHLHTGEKKNRFSLRKNIVDDNSGRTEEEINKSNGWVRCYDCGCTKWEFFNKVKNDI